MIYNDGLEISSHGTLPFGITVDDLKKRHESLPRNERITKVMNKTGNIESVDTGIQEMIKACKELDKPEPEYIERGNTFVVCFRKSILTLKDNVDIRQNKNLSLLKQQNGLSSAEIKKRLDVTISERTLRRDLNHLMEIGRIRLGGRVHLPFGFLKKLIIENQ
jgi:ATP-dependent DNA helicase RecG